MDAAELNFRTLPGLWQEYAEVSRSLAYSPAEFPDAACWQQKLRAEVWRLLGISPEPACDLNPQFLASAEDEHFTIQKIAIQTQPNEHLPCYRLVPRQTTSRQVRPIIAIHGHGSLGARALFSHPTDQAEALHLQTLNYSFASQLASQGYLVFVPEMRGFGERIEPSPFQDCEDPLFCSSCYALSVNALLLGKTLLGLRILDLIRLIDYIHTRPDGSPEALGCVGFSGGGTLALFASALDPRITCTAISGCFGTLQDSIMAIRHCICNYIPGIAPVADTADIAGLIAPRPLYIESGIHDPIFPNSAALKAFPALKEIYAGFSALDKLELETFDGAHRWHGKRVSAWLEQWL